MILKTETQKVANPAFDLPDVAEWGEFAKTGVIRYVDDNGNVVDSNDPIKSG